MSRENIGIANFLSTFGMASESCLNNLRVSRDQQEKLFDQFRATQDGPTRKQIMLQLNQITQQEASQMQFMLDISRCMLKAYGDLIANFISSLTNLVLLRRDAYLRHAHPNLDAFRLCNLCLATTSGDLFDRTLVQEQEHHLIGLGVKPGSKKDRFHPYKKHKKGRGGQRQPPQGVYYQPMPAPQYMVQQPFFPTLTRGVTEEAEAVLGDPAVGVTKKVASNNSLLNDISQTVLPSKNPGQRPKTPLDILLDYLPQCASPEGEKTPSV